MDEILEKNLRALKGSHEDLYEYIMSGENLDCEYSQGVASSSENVDGRLILFAVRDEQLYLLESTDAGQSLYDTWVNGIKAGTESKYVILGFGNGSILKSILKGMRDNGTILVYEPDLKLFTHVIENYDVSEVLGDGRLSLLYPQIERDQEKDLFHTLGSLLEYTDIDSLVISDYPNYRNIYPEAWEHLNEKTEEVISAMVANRSVMARFGKAFVQNIFVNMPYFKESRSAFSLEGKLPEKVPVIVVSSGPSLNKNIEVLKKAKGRSFIIAADSAASVLLNADIVPDMFFCVDAKKNPGHFTHEKIGEIPIGCEPETAPAAFRDRRGLCFFFKGMNPHIESFLSENGIELIEIDSGGSVANAATDFAMHLGAKQVILVGQDLAYTGNKSHARGSLRAAWDMDLTKNECYIEGQDGEQVRSSMEFVKYKSWFERVIERRKDIGFINATEGGAKIHGAVQMSLEEAVSEYCVTDFDVAGFLESAEKLFDEKARAKLDDYMAELDEAVKEISVQIDEGIKSYTEMYKLATENKQGKPRFMKLYEKTREVGEKLNSSSVMYYIENMVQQEMTVLMDKHAQDKTSEKGRLLADIDSGIDYFKLVKKGMSEFQQILKTENSCKQ